MQQEFTHQVENLSWLMGYHILFYMTHLHNLQILDLRHLLERETPEQHTLSGIFLHRL